MPSPSATLPPLPSDVPVPEMVLPPGQLDQTEQIRRVQRVADKLHHYGTAQGIDSTPDEHFRQQLAALLLPEADFRAGALSNHLPAWRRWQRQAPHRDDAAVCSMLTVGLQPHFGLPTAPGQEKHPHHRKNSRIAQRLVASV